VIGITAVYFFNTAIDLNVSSAGSFDIFGGPGTAALGQHARAVRVGDPRESCWSHAALEDLAVELYARGLSTRDIEDAFRDESGRRLLSRAAVSEITERLWAEYEAFSKRDLSEWNCRAATCWPAE
jgi:hypothetical protein